MPRPSPPLLLKERTRHGRTVWYVRRGDGPRTRIKGEYGSDEFWTAYHAAIENESPRAAIAASGTLQWLWEQYRETAAWASLSPATRRQRENIMLHVLAKSGGEPFAAITEGDIEAGKDARRATPSQARNWLDAMKGLFRWAKKAQHVKTDPTRDVDNPKRPKTKGFPEWTEADVVAYHARWPLGTCERVWLDMLLYTGPRRGDVSRLGRQHVRNCLDGREIAFKTEKGGELIEVTIPLLPVLEATLAAGPCGDLTFIVGAKGKSFTKESFGNAFSSAARMAGVKKSAHGVRKIAATTMADNGATAHQLMAIFGWKTIQMAELYTREANRRRLGRESAHMLGRSIPAPERHEPRTAYLVEQNQEDNLSLVRSRKVP
jgi:Site-specific recombinase XerD